MLGAVGIDVEPIGQLGGRNPYSAVTVRRTPGDETGAYTNDSADLGDKERRKEEKDGARVNSRNRTQSGASYVDTPLEERGRVKVHQCCGPVQIRPTA